MEVLKSAAHEVSFPLELQNVHLLRQKLCAFREGVKKTVKKWFSAALPFYYLSLDFIMYFSLIFITHR